MRHLILMIDTGEAGNWEQSRIQLHATNMLNEDVVLGKDGQLTGPNLKPGESVELVTFDREQHFFMLKKDLEQSFTQYSRPEWRMDFGSGIVQAMFIDDSALEYGQEPQY